MSVEKAKRVVMRLREKHGDLVIESQLRHAIMMECGTDDRTIERYKDALMELKWIKRLCRNKYSVDTKDVVGEMF